MFAQAIRRLKNSTLPIFLASSHPLEETNFFTCIHLGLGLLAARAIIYLTSRTHYSFKVISPTASGDTPWTPKYPSRHAFHWHKKSGCAVGLLSQVENCRCLTRTVRSSIVRSLESVLKKAGLSHGLQINLSLTGLFASSQSRVEQPFLPKITS